MGDLKDFLEKHKTSQVESGLEFALNEERGIQLVRESLTALPRAALPLHFLASSVEAGATYFRYSRRPDLKTHLRNVFLWNKWQFKAEHDGLPPGIGEMEELERYVFRPCSRSLRRLALAYVLSQRLERVHFRLEACRGERMDRLVYSGETHKLERELALKRPFTGVRLAVLFGQTPDEKLGFMPGLEHLAIQKWGARAPLELSHRSLKSVHERTLFSAYWQAGPTCLWAKETARERAGDVSVRIELGEYSGEWAFLVSGLEAEHSLTASFWGAKMFVTSPRLKLDAQYLGVVRDDDFEQVTEEADSLRTEALEELAAQFLKTDKLKEHDRYASLLRYFTRLAAQEKAFSGLPALYNLKLFGEELTAREIIATLRERPYLLRMLSRDERAAIRECLANDDRSLRTGKGYQPFRIVSQKGRYALIDQDGRSGVFDPEIGEVLRISAQYGPTYLDETEHIFYEQFVAFEPFRIELRSVSLAGDKLWAPVHLEKTYTALVVGPERRYWLAVDGTVEELDSRGTVVWSLELPEWKGCLCHDDCFIIWNDDEWGAFDPEKRDWAYREPRAFPRVRSAGSFLVVDEVDEDLFSVFRLEDKSIEKLRTFQGTHSRLIDGFVIFTDDSGERAFDLSGKLEEKAVFELLQAREAEVLAPSLHNDGPRSMAFVAGSLVWQSERGCGVLECSTGRTLFHSDSVFQTGFIQRGEENLARRVSSVLHLRTGRWTDVSRYFIQGSGWIGFCSPSGPCVGCAELEDFIPVEHLSAEIELVNDQWLVRESQGSYQYKHHRDTEWTVLGNGSFIDVELLGSFALGRSREVVEAFELSSGRTVFRSQGILLGSDQHSLQFVVLERKRLVCITLGHPPTQELLPISNEEVRDWFDSFSKPYAPFLWSTNNARFLTPEVLALPHQEAFQKRTAKHFVRSDQGWREADTLPDLAQFLNLHPLGNRLAWRPEPHNGCLTIVEPFTAETLGTFHAQGASWLFYTPYGDYDFNQDGLELLCSQSRAVLQPSKHRKGLLQELLRQSEHPLSN